MNTLFSEYRHLLTGRETLAALDSAVTLLEKASGLHVRLRRGLLTITRIPNWTPPVKSWISLAVGDAFQASANGDRALRVPPGTRHRALRTKIIRTSWCLTALPRQLSAIQVDDTQYAFIMDCSLLLFHQAYFALLPRLEGARWIPVRNTLVSAFFRFAEQVPDIADRFRITGLAHQARGDAVGAAALFEKALLASHVDEHVYMSRLQTLWMALLDKRDFEPALRFLLKVMPIVPLKHLPELTELILSTFAEVSAVPETRATG
jgi:hypothetical protein